MLVIEVFIHILDNEINGQAQGSCKVNDKILKRKRKPSTDIKEVDIKKSKTDDEEVLKKKENDSKGIELSYWSLRFNVVLLQTPNQIYEPCFTILLFFRASVLER